MMERNIIRKSFNALLKLSFSIMIFQGLLYSSQLHVSIHDPVYQFLERMATQGALLDYKNTTLPITRNYIADMLTHLTNNRNMLCTIDIMILEEYLADYNYELKDKPYFQLNEDVATYHPFQSWDKVKGGFKDVLLYTTNQEDHHFVVYEKEDNLVWFDVGGITRYESKNSDDRLIYSYKYSLSVLLSEKVIAYSEANLYEMLYNKDNDKMPPEFKGGFPGDTRHGYYGFKQSRGFDYSYGYLQYSSNIGDVILSMEPLVWGNAINPIILSNNVNPFPAFVWTKSIGKSRFTFLHGSISSINQDVLAVSDINYAVTNNFGKINKYIVSHRWEITLSNKFRGAFTEMLIYGGRDPDLSYIIPTTLLWSVQHNTNNYDNIIWFVESEYFPFNGFKLYNTIMLDELTLSKMFHDYINNKWIIQGGVQYVYNIFDYPGSINIEFTASRPWVYTHKSPGTSSYTYNGRSLGFKHGPNSQLFHLGNYWWINSRNRFGISYEQLKWGHEPDGDMYDNHDFGNDPNHNYANANMGKYAYNTGWLIGEIEITHNVRFLWEYQLSNIIGMELGFSHIKIVDKSVNMMSIQMNVDY